MSLQILTGYTDSSHITASRAARLYRSVFGEGNKIIDTQASANSTPLGVTVTPGSGSASTGSVSVTGDCFLFDGRLGEFEGTTTATYNRPQSSGLHTRVCVAIRYQKNGSGVESFSLVCCQSEIAQDVSTAPIYYGESEIPTVSIGDNPSNGATAYFPLWEFTAASTSYTTPVAQYTKVENVALMAARLDALEDADDALDERLDPVESWKTSTTTENTTRDSRLNTLENWKDTANAKLITVTNLGATSSGHVGYNTYYASYSGSYDFFLISATLNAFSSGNFYSRTTILAKSGVEEIHATKPIVDTGSPQTIIIPYIKVTHSTSGSTKSISVSAADSQKITHQAVTTLDKSTETCSLSAVTIYGIKF